MTSAIPPSSSFPFGNLPSELLIKITRALDGYSLNSLLEADPSLRQAFVLISNGANPSIFTCEGLRRLSLFPSLKSNAHLRPGVRNRFKLYELFLYDDDQGQSDQDYFDECHIEQLVPTLDEYSFVQAVTDGSGYPLPNRLITSIKNNSRAVCEISTFGVPEKTVMDSPSLSRVSCECSCIQPKSLVIKYVNVIEDIYLSHVTKLTIVFGKTDTTPIIKNLTCPKIRSLKIVYQDAFPDIQSLFIKRVKYQKESYGTVLEFVHAPSMKTLIKGPLPYTHHRLTEATIRTLAGYDNPDDPFGEITYPLSTHFRTLNIIGGPNELLEKALPCDPKDYYHGKYTLSNLHYKRTTLDPEMEPDYDGEFSTPPTVTIPVSNYVSCKHVGMWNLSFECCFDSAIPFKISTGSSGYRDAFAMRTIAVLFHEFYSDMFDYDMNFSKSYRPGDRDEYDDEDFDEESDEDSDQDTPEHIKHLIVPYNLDQIPLPMRMFRAFLSETSAIANTKSMYPPFIVRLNDGKHEERCDRYIGDGTLMRAEDTPYNELPDYIRRPKWEPRPY